VTGAIILGSGSLVSLLYNKFLFSDYLRDVKLDSDLFSLLVIELEFDILPVPKLLLEIVSDI
jgi:hypothetical protein